MYFIGHNQSEFKYLTRVTALKPQYFIIKQPIYADLRKDFCNGFTYLQLGRDFINILLFKYMSFYDDPPHNFSQFLLL